MQSIYIAMSAWREILAQTLGHLQVQENVSPSWLVNPATQRRLKLDLYYPDAALAIRFVGLTAKGQKRQSDWELLESEQRDQTRAELCRLNGVQLAIIDPAEEPLKQFDRFIQALSVSAKSTTGIHKSKGKAPLQSALQKASELRSRLSKNPEQFMATLAECWRDRETGMLNELARVDAQPKPLPAQGTNKKLAKNLSVGQSVAHERFGLGQITEVDGKDAERRISILFEGNEQPRTFLMDLVLDKLTMVKGTA